MSCKASLAVSILVAAACGGGSGGGGGGGGGSDGGNGPPVNHAPVADAGPDQSVTTGALVTLDGSASSDSDGDLLTYRWSFSARPAGSKAVLASALSVQPTFAADVAGSYVISLVVNDGTVDSTADSVMVTATTGNAAPVANAGADQHVVTGSLVTLDGSASSDADGDLLTYRWSFVSRPAGSQAALSSRTDARPTFTADRDGSYVIDLVVNDGTVDSAADSVTVTAATQNSAPTANAGSDQHVATGTLVTLDGSASSDADGNQLTYRWSFVSLPPGSTAALSSTTAVETTFTADVDGTYVASLIVNDGTVDSAADTVTVTAATQNSAPVANAGPDQSVVAGTLVTLDGSASSDADGDALSYEWAFVSKPPGSAAALSSATAVHPTFTADRIGSYVISLVVADGTASSAADTVAIAATSPVGGQCTVVQDGPIASDVALLLDGRIVIVGGNALISVLERYESDASGGVILAQITGSARAVAVQADGKILVAGKSVRAPLQPSQLTLRRFDTSGVLDASFGTNGVVFFDGNGTEGVAALRVQPDGKILVVGSLDVSTDRDVLLLRFLSNGALDTSFGSGGVVIFDSGMYEFGGNQLALQTDGKILVVGTVQAATQDVLLLRFRTDGSLDTSFGTSGVVTFDGGEWDSGEAVAVQPDGRILVGGARAIGDQGHALLLRYTTTGALDPTFGTGGVVVGEPGAVYALALQSGGRIVAGGVTTIIGTLFSVAQVARYNAVGALDPAFGSDGVFVYDGGFGADRFSALALATDGSIVAAGASNEVFSPYGSGGQLLLARLFDVCR